MAIYFFHDMGLHALRGLQGNRPERKERFHHATCQQTGLQHQHDLLISIALEGRIQRYANVTLSVFLSKCFFSFTPKAFPTTHNEFSTC